MDFVSIQLSHDCLQPLYQQLFHQIKGLILQGSWTAGEKLPAIRAAAAELNLNTVTVVHAYRELERNGYVASRKGSGFYIAETTDSSKADKISRNGKAGLFLSGNAPLDGETINFASASPHPSIFPTDSFTECIQEVLGRDKGFAFGYQESNGFLPLRESIRDYLDRESVIHTTAEYIQVVSGSQQGIDIIGKALLNPGDYVMTETPTYDGATAVFASRGARVVGVQLESDGMDMIDLEKKIRICKPKFIYMMSKFQNPTTLCYSKEKLQTLLQLAVKYNAYVVEDDSMSELRFEDQESHTLKAMDLEGAERVIYVKSFSKLLMPGLRVGFLVIPPNLLDTFTGIKRTTDISSSGLIQRALDLYFRQNKWEEHIRYMKEIYRGKYELMAGWLENLQKYGIRFTCPRGGLYFWIRLPSSISARALHEACARANLQVLPSGSFYVNPHKDNDAFLRLSFASSTIEQLKAGMQILEQCIVQLRA